MHLPELPDVLDTLRVVALPMAVRFRGVDTREAALFEGPEGWTEFSPFVEYDDAEASAWLAGALDYGWRATPPTVRDRIHVNATVPAVPATDVPGVLARFDGCRTVKVKVAERGQRPQDDIDRVRAVRAELGPEARIRIDANGGWNLDEAERAIHAMNEFDLEYAEQPCATIDELAELRYRIKYSGVLIAADESVRKAEDPLAVARARAADVVIVKAQPLGGLHRALAVVAEAGLPAVISSALDTAVGIAMGTMLAGALPNLDFDCGLGTASLIRDDVADAHVRGGVLPVGRISPDPAALDRLAADAERTQWWRERITRCHTLLSERV
ncbi:o-succinylbenzoate synthase [Microbacterium gorillae]|uniref:o-succinylbenzoate synthase n=1 Tax=Microbacterium gorillae TaxID=1231063 RepID=UPI00059001E5|nr:o-succinylbenzoate synthase [Microbacterium gorillae]